MSIEPIHAWIIPIKGHQFDIEDFSILFIGYAVQIVKRLDEKCYLKLPVEFSGLDPGVAREKALGYLARINGAAILLSDSYRPLELGEELFGVSQNDKIVNTVIRPECAQMRFKEGHVVISINGIPQPDTRLGAALPFMNAAEKSTAAEDVLILMGRKNPSWSELYLIYELVQANSGNQMVAKGWISRSKEIQFCRTANNYTALGRHARHGKNNVQSPSSPMTYEQAKEVIRLLAASWLREAATETSGDDG